MTRSKLKNDLTYLARAAGLPTDDLSDHVDFCIDQGLADFWNAHGWSWRTRPYTLSISATAEQYQLTGASDFAGVQTIRQKSSQHGGEIVFLAKEMYDRKFPHPTSFNAGYQRFATAYYNGTDKQWYMKFMPAPEAGYTVYMDIYTKAGSVEGVPEGFTSGLKISIDKYLYPLAAQRLAADEKYTNEVNRLINTDSPFQGLLVEIIQPGGDIGEESWMQKMFG